MRERFCKNILTNGRCVLSIRTPDDVESNTAGDCLMPDGEAMDQEEVTPLLLHMLSEAYHSGYKQATLAGADAVTRLLLESNHPRKPAPKIYPSEVIDYQKFLKP